MKQIILALLLLISTSAFADEIYLDTNIAAHHWDREVVHQLNLNEHNPGLGLDWTNGDTHTMIGFYKNSNYKETVYAMKAWTPINVSIFHAGGFIGAATGYEIPLAPMAGAMLITNLTKQINVNIVMVPTIKRYNAYGFAGFQLAFKL